MPRFVMPPLLLTWAFAFWASLGWAKQGDVFYEQRLDPYPVPMILPVNIGDRVYPFLLDTGSSRTLCDTPLRSALGPLLAQVPAATPSGTIRVPFYEAPPMAVGRGRISPTAVGLQDFSVLRKATGFNIRGILGAAALQGTAIWLDYDHRSLKLAKGFRPKGMQELDLLYGSDGVSPYLALLVGGTRVKFCLDLGFNGTVGLSEKTTAKLLAAGIMREYGSNDEFSITVGGRMKNRSGILVKGDILGQRFADVSVTNKGDFNMLGLEFLMNYNAVIDFEKSKFYYQPRRATPAVNVYSMMGAILFCEDGCGVVYEVRSGGPAARAGLRKGDTVVRLGTIIRGGFNAASLYELGMQKAGSSLDVVALRKGKKDPIVTRLTLEK